jgi:tol-pal system protein YbgF
MRRSSLLIGALFLAGAALTPLSAGAQDNADYDKRIQRLEEQIVDLSAQLGTVETMGQGGGAAAPSSGGQFSSGGSGGADDGGRLAEIETQVRALAAQMSETLRRVQRIEQRSGGLAPSEQPNGASENPRASRQQPASRASSEQSEQGTGFSVGGEDKEPSNNGGFGTTVEPGQGKSGGRADNGSSFGAEPDANSGRSSSVSSAAPVRTAANSSPQARALYEQSYNALVQRNYRAAEDGFAQFVQAYSNDPLAGSAFFWMGEAAFTSGEYRKAADSFLKSSTNYPQNEKAAESLLKLGIALKRLGENKAACSSFAELSRRFPSATQVIQRAEREKSRAQC